MGVDVGSDRLPDAGGDVQALLGEDGGAVGATDDGGMLERAGQEEVVCRALLDADPNPVGIDVGGCSVGRASGTAYTPSMRT